VDNGSIEQGRVRIGIVGTGSVFGNAYGPELRMLEYRGLARVVAGCDSVPGKEVRFRSWFPSARFSTRPQDVIEDDAVEVVVVLTPHATHAEISLEALRAGKHVMVEKPMSLSLAEGARMVQLSRDAGLVLVCAPHVVLSATYQAIWTRLRKGEIGEVALARARYGEFGDHQRAVGSALHGILDLAVYNITSLTGWLGPAVSVTAMSGPSDAHLLLRHADGAISVVTSGWSMHQTRGPALELYGREGVIQMLGADWDPDGYERWLPADRVWRIHPDADLEYVFTAGLEHLVRCVRSHEEPIVTPEQAYHVLEIMLKAGESASGGVTRAIDSTFPDLRIDVSVIDLNRQYAHDGISGTFPFKDPEAYANTDA
jgi:predicted dehydrogenase